MPKLTQQKLERHLWGAADILRATVDAGDYKQYIFGLLFYKHLCDVWDEEYEALLAGRQRRSQPDPRHQAPASHQGAGPITDANGRPLSFFMTAGQISDYTGAAALLDDLPKAQWLLGDRGYDADWFRDALQQKGIKPCIPGRKSRLDPIKYDKRRYKRRNRIEIMFGRLKDWRRVATRYDRCPTVFFSAIALAATVIFWL
jgi:transposase